jgi:hypothetical protein
LQEYILSRRVLIYGSCGLRWSCRDAEWYDDEEAAATALSWDVDKRLASLRDLSQDYDLVRLDWQSIVSEYTDRTLSVPTDRLLAISGVAETYAGIFKDDYLAGIWRRQLPAALLWHTARPLSSWGFIVLLPRLGPPSTALYMEANFRSQSTRISKIVEYSIQLEEARSPFEQLSRGILSSRV